MHRDALWVRVPVAVFEDLGENPRALSLSAPRQFLSLGTVGTKVYPAAAAQAQPAAARSSAGRAQLPAIPSRAALHLSGPGLSPRLGVRTTPEEAADSAPAGASAG